MVDGCMVVRCTGGTASFRMDFKTCRICAGDYIFLFNDMVVVLEERSADFRVEYVSVPDDRVFEICVNITSPKFWDRLYISPVQTFDAKYRAILDSWTEQCVFVCRNCRRANTDTIIPRQIQSLFMVMEDIICRNGAAAETKLPVMPWKIVSEYYVLLSLHYTTEHKVAFYADKLNITPDYLTVLLKKCTGESAKSLIEGKLVMAMKALLESTALPVKSIAERLHYEDSSHLCRVFRRNTGISPTEYRRRRQNRHGQE